MQRLQQIEENVVEVEGCPDGHEMQRGIGQTWHLPTRDRVGNGSTHVLRMVYVHHAQQTGSVGVKDTRVTAGMDWVFVLCVCPRVLAGACSAGSACSVCTECTVCSACSVGIMAIEVIATTVVVHHCVGFVLYPDQDPGSGGTHGGGGVPAMLAMAMFHVFERHLVPVADQGGLIVDAVLGPCIDSILCIPCIRCIPCIHCIHCIRCIHCKCRVLEGDPKRPVPPSIFVVGDGSTGQKTNGLTTGNARHPTLFWIVFFEL